MVGVGGVDYGRCSRGVVEDDYGVTTRCSRNIVKNDGGVTTGWCSLGVVDGDYSRCSRGVVTDSGTLCVCVCVVIRCC